MQLNISITTKHEHNTAALIKKLMDAMREIVGDDFDVLINPTPSITLKDLTGQLPKSNYTINIP
jgi:hypothetical protein